MAETTMAFALAGLGGSTPMGQDFSRRRGTIRLSRISSQQLAARSWFSLPICAAKPILRRD